jgi:hypothetical protein
MGTSLWERWMIRDVVRLDFLRSTTVHQCSTTTRLTSAQTITYRSTTISYHHILSSQPPFIPTTFRHNRHPYPPPFVTTAIHIHTTPIFPAIHLSDSTVTNVPYCQEPGPASLTTLLLYESMYHTISFP